MSKDMSLKLNAMELDPNKVYHITLEVGDMPKQEVMDYLEKAKSLFDKYDIKAIYSATNQGIHFITITELPMMIKE